MTILKESGPKEDHACAAKSSASRSAIWLKPRSVWPAGPCGPTREQLEDQLLNAQAMGFVSSTKIDTTIELLKDSIR